MVALAGSPNSHRGTARPARGFSGGPSSRKSNPHRGLYGQKRGFTEGDHYIDELISYTRTKPGKASERFYAHANHLYSVAAITDAAGQVVERSKYDAHGKRTLTNSVGATLAKSAVGNDTGFTGRLDDIETGLMHFRGRKYSTSQGRFIARDRYGYVDGWQLYRGYFVPYGLDPSGYVCCYIGNGKYADRECCPDYAKSPGSCGENGNPPPGSNPPPNPNPPGGPNPPNPNPPTPPEPDPEEPPPEEPPPEEPEPWDPEVIYQDCLSACGWNVLCRLGCRVDLASDRVAADHNLDPEAHRDAVDAMHRSQEEWLNRIPTPPVGRAGQIAKKVLGAAEHTKNARRSTKDKHEKPRPGRDSEKKKQKKGWKSR